MLIELLLINYKINTTSDDEKDEAEKPTKPKAKTKKPKADEIEEEIPF